MAKIQSYNLHSMETGRENKGFEHDDSKNNVVPIQNIPRKQLTSTVVEGLGDDREQWGKPIEFLLSCVAMSVGLGNIWRFPFTAYENGGGAFLIPYLIVLFFIGKPLYFLELAIGQFSSKGQVQVWRLNPFFKGVGYGSAFGTACVVSYYCTLMALTIFYFIASFQSVLPWTECNDSWENVTCHENGTVARDSTTGKNLTIPELYFQIDVLKQKDTIVDGIGMPDWRLTLCLLASWVVILLSLIKGVKSAGKVAYFTALFPYFVLIILLIRGVTLNGSWEGILYFITPQWSKLLEPKVWYAAVGQCFFSLSTGFGPIIMFASYNPFKHNVYRDAMIISLMDTFTSLLAGFTIFAILGNLASELNVDITEVARGGPGLAFVSYPQAIAQFDWLPQLFSVLFFLMLFTLGVGSATSLTGGLITIIHDKFPATKKSWITTGVCLVGFISGLSYVTPGGQWILTLVDHFGGTLIIYVMATLEIIGIAWFYGLSNICRDINFMLGIRISFYWKFCWGFFIPVLLSIILVYSLITNGNPLHEKQEFPTIALVFGWLLAAFAILLFPICAIHTIATRKSDTLKGKILESFKPTSDWGPSRQEDRQNWIQHPTNLRTFTSMKQAVVSLKNFLRRK